ncbi:MAG TPA: hypothetical protein DCP38_10995 [Acidobacteria bacterium]|jgi:hypothetical protein|nr:hypothetical protein [Acidobacteriota bacterium]MDP6371772.1 hypothetical protein [Vicinamibacterales bacterium]HAK55990.1 hypothetical protein [Acidobacteriota bacterium]|tara:strand:+ start:12654 stop:12863 length:210 start_codon:yes stop_codon:yes gene_type:complete
MKNVEAARIVTQIAMSRDTFSRERDWKVRVSEWMELESCQTATLPIRSMITDPRISSFQKTPRGCSSAA